MDIEMGATSFIKAWSILIGLATMPTNIYSHLQRLFKLRSLLHGGCAMWCYSTRCEPGCHTTIQVICEQFGLEGTYMLQMWCKHKWWGASSTIRMPQTQIYLPALLPIHPTIASPILERDFCNIMQCMDPPPQRNTLWMAMEMIGNGSS